jgi:hypothetical protein
LKLTAASLPAHPLSTENRQSGILVAVQLIS